MPLSISVTSWSDLGEEQLAAIKEHAARKAMEPIDWDEWLKIDKGGGMSFQISYPMAETLDIVLDVWGVFGYGELCFVPYQFNYNLSTEFPPSDHFWQDTLRPPGTSESYLLTVVSALWLHTRMIGTTDDNYWKTAEADARRFEEEYDKLKEANFEDQYIVTRHYIETGLLKCLNYGMDWNLPIIVYP